MNNQVNSDYEIDALTQCKSKYSLICDVTNEVIIQSERYISSFLCIDIDNFQHYVDYNGFGSSDKSLIEIAERLKKLYPKSEVYRHGGDEFVVAGEDKFKKDVGNGLNLNIKHSIVRVDTFIEKGRPHRTASWVMLHIHSGIVNSTIRGTSLECLDRITK